MALPNDPATEQTLKKVLEALNRAFPAGGRSIGGGASKTERNEVPTSGRSGKFGKSVESKTIVATTRALEKLKGAGNNAASSLSGVVKQSDKVKGSFVGLNSSLTATMRSLSLSRAEIRKLNFGGIASEIEKAVSESMSGLKTGKDDKGTEKVSAGKAVSRFADMMDSRVNPRLDKFSRVLRLTSNALIGFLRELRDGSQSGDLSPRARRKKAPSFPSDWTLIPLDAKSESEGKVKKGFDARKKTTVTVLKSDKPKKIKAKKEGAKEAPDDQAEDKLKERKLPDNFNEALIGELRSRGLNSKQIEHSTMMFSMLGVILARVGSTINQVVSDSFEVLAARGYGTTDSLMSLYGASITAGMSLREYAQMMDRNMIAVSRASSFGEFQKNLKFGADGLKKFGLFGENANELAATMMSASTSLGVPQAQMQDAMKAQTESFAALRKTTNITAREFAELTKTVSEDANVRTELSALAPEERVKRQSALVDQAAYARSLNLSESEVKKFTQAILDQRKSTVKQRFQQAGRLTQAAGMLGMDQGKVDELRKLSMNKYKTKEEQERYQALLGEVNTGIEKMQQSGTPGSQYQADTIRENLTSSGVDLDTASAIKAGKESGEVKNKDLGKELGPLGQAIGSLYTFLQGLGKNPLAALGITIVSGIATIVATMRGLGVSIGTTAGKIIATSITGKVGGLTPPGGPTQSGRPTQSGAPGLPESGKRRWPWQRKPAGAPGAPSPTAPTGISTPDWSTSMGADGSGSPAPNASTQPEAKAKGKWANRASRAGGALKSAAGGKVGLVGAAVGLGVAGMNYMGAEEAAKEENGGDGDVGKAKGEAIGEGVGATAGTIIGGAIGSIIPVFGTAIGAAFGGLLGGWAGKLLGGAVSAESAAEKNARETKKNTEEMIKARRGTAGSTVVSSDNLGSLTQNVMQSARAYTAPTAEELAKYAESKKSPEQKAAEKKTKIDDEVKNTTKAQWAQYEEKAMANLPKEGRTTGMIEKEKERLARIDAEKRVDAKVVTPTSTGTPVPENKVEPAKEGGFFSGVSSALGTAASAVTSLFASPSSQTPSSVNPTVVNRTDQTQVAETAKKAGTELSQSPTALSDPGEVLKQILEILKQSLNAETQQVELATTMLRAQSLTPYLPDKQDMIRRVNAQV